jgi:hypothetical protein
MPAARLVVVTASGSATSMESCFVAFWSAASSTRTVNVYAPGEADGVPESAPVDELRERPFGSAPDWIDHA